MDKSEVAKNLIELHSDYAILSSKYGDLIKSEYSEAVSQAIMLLNPTEKGGVQE